MRIVISPGHGLKVRGASDIIDEVDEARKVVPKVANWLRRNGHDVIEFYEDIATTQDENLHRIVDNHNSHNPELNISVHFNAYEHTSKAMGTECLYLTQGELAQEVAAAVATAGRLINRGPKKRTDLYFLNKTEAPAILIELCFVDSEADVASYRAHGDAICEAIGSIGASAVAEEPWFQVTFEGACSQFGGPDDKGVDPDEGLAFFYEVDDAPHLFLDKQPKGTTGLARRLDPEVFYVACRWDYDITPKEMLRDKNLKAMVANKETGKMALAWPADWGPHEDTDREADLSPGLMEELELLTDDEVEVIYPWRE